SRRSCAPSFGPAPTSSSSAATCRRASPSANISTSRTPSSAARNPASSMACSTGWPACCGPTTSSPEAAALDEVAPLARYSAPLPGPGALGLRDDAAVIPGPGGSDLVLTTDAIVEGVHFLEADPPDLVARKLLRVNLSDLAAKGATPLGYLLTTALPRRC